MTDESALFRWLMAAVSVSEEVLSTLESHSQRQQRFPAGIDTADERQTDHSAYIPAWHRV